MATDLFFLFLFYMLLWHPTITVICCFTANHVLHLNTYFWIQVMHVCWCSCIFLLWLMHAVQCTTYIWDKSLYHQESIWFWLLLLFVLELLMCFYVHMGFLYGCCSINMNRKFTGNANWLLMCVHQIKKLFSWRKKSTCLNIYEWDCILCLQWNVLYLLNCTFWEGFSSFVSQT